MTVPDYACIVGVGIVIIVEVGEVALGSGILPCIIVADMKTDGDASHRFYIQNTDGGGVNMLSLS